MWRKARVQDKPYEGYACVTSPRGAAENPVCGREDRHRRASFLFADGLSEGNTGSRDLSGQPSRTT